MSTKCECSVCKKNLPFDFPEEIIDEILRDNLVLFAGAGISTETKDIFKKTFYDDICSELKIENPTATFPELMSLFCDSTINGRQKLLDKIRKRFEYVHQFKELYISATEFHSEISSLWMLKNIITTNWDDFFERECNAIPIISSKDFAFYNINQRKVFKIHGSISNYGSIIATTEDYEKCYNELSTGLVGANLKTLLATKAILFVGYSFRDFDFNKVLELLKLELDNVYPHFYIVTLDDKIPDSLKGLNFTLIKTTGTFFFKKVKEHFVENKYLISEDDFNLIYDVDSILGQEHSELGDFFINKNKNCAIIYSMIYQDGVSHAIDALQYHSKNGQSLNPFDLLEKIETYEVEFLKKYSKAKNYMEIAYINGYIEGLSIPFYYNDLLDFPFFYLFGVGPTNDKNLAYEAFEKNIIRHKMSERIGEKHFKDYLDKENKMVIHHRPFL